MSETDSSREFREWVSETQRRRGWNKSDFARAVGVDSSLVSRWLQGRQPRPEKIRQIAQRLGADEDELLRMAGHRRSRSGGSPQHAELIAKMEQVRLTPERYRILDTLLEELRRHEP